MNQPQFVIEKPFLSLCMIVKNESKNLQRCLTSVKPYVDEMIIVDTGSEDNTLEIASEQGAKICFFQWCDDFALARNYAISQASGDWILVLDADEKLVIESDVFLKKIRSSSPEIVAYNLMRVEANYYLEMTPLLTPRLFRNLPEIMYKGRFHEQLIYHHQYLNSQQVETLDRIKILHYGYSQEEINRKNANRNIPILERIRQEEGLNLMLLYCLSGMYHDMQQFEKSQECCAEAFERLLPNLLSGNPPEEFLIIPSLLYTLGAQSLNQEDYETTQLICQRGLEWCPLYPPINYLAGMMLMALGFPLGALMYFKQCIQIGARNQAQGEPFEKSFVTIDPAVSLGNAYLQLKRWQEAKSAFELALSYAPNCEVAQQNLAVIQQIIETQSS